MKKITLSLFFTIFIFINFVRSQLNVVDSVFIYNIDGTKEWYNVQKDVFCFSLTDNSKYTGQLPPCVDTIVYYNNSYSQFNEIHFKPSSTLIHRMNCLNTITSLNNFKLLAPALSKTTNNYTAHEFFQTDDVLMILFNDTDLSINDVNTFADKYELEMTHKPFTDLPNGISWAYSFKLKASPKDKYRTSVKLATILNEEEPILVKYADPNVHTVEYLSCDPVDEMIGNFYQNTNGSWFLNNNGGPIWQGKSGIAGADAHICECWGEGATGQGIKIGVIDHGGFQFSHPDFANANIPYVYDAINQEKVFIDMLFNNETTSHSMMVTGIIAAQPNNLTTSNGYAVGGAYNATVIPYLCGLSDDVEPILIAVQRSRADKCDILNMSLTIKNAGNILQPTLNNAINTGRQDPNNSNVNLGMVVVAGTGNTNSNVSLPNFIGTTPYPANQLNTIGVGWSNPDDYRASPQTHGTNGGSWGIINDPAHPSGSVYGGVTSKFDVVAPGMLIRTSDLINNSSNGYEVVRGASISTPVVSSIAAMILQKRPDLTYQQVKEVIRNGADKVHNLANGGPNDIYNYTMGQPGYNDEMFYGRVNCFKSLKLAETLGVKENNQTLETIIRNNEDGTYIIYTPQNERLKQVTVYDLSGKLLINEKMQSEVSLKIDLTFYGIGIYLLKIYDSEGNCFATKLLR